MGTFTNRATGLSTRRGLALTIVAGFACGSVNAQAVSGAPAPRGRDTAAPNASPEVEEVVVTAQKRVERLQDVPVPVTALSGESLLAGNQLRLQDFYTSVPGLALTSAGGGTTNLSIRGVTTGSGTNPTVGIMVDDAPFGSTTALGARLRAPDIDPGELARVEVLRGPQGTLYGASSIGGLLKFVTLDPSTEAFSGHAQLSASDVYNGDGNGYGARVGVNVPVNENFAFRASGFARRDAGYIDDPFLGVKGVNSQDTFGGRLSALWRLPGDWSVKVSALGQDSDTDGGSFSTSQQGLGKLQQSLTLRGGDAYRQSVRSYTATVSGPIRGATFTSISGYSVAKYDSPQDISALFGEISQAVYGVAGATLKAHSKTSKFTEELRLAASISPKLDALVGFFYTEEDNSSHDVYNAVDPSDVATVGLLFDDPFPTTYKEYAAFADLTVHVTDRLDVQIGGRESQNRQSYTETIEGPGWAFLGLPNPSIEPMVHTKDRAFTYLLTPSFKISPDAMLYARLASGYRPGGPNPTCTLFPAPCQYQPDKTNNYEVGFKATTLGRALTLDVSAYYIDWKKIQLQVTDAATGGTYFTNASRARSQGLELAAELKPAAGTRLAAWVVWNDAQLEEDLPSNGPLGLSGDKLPYSSKISANVSASTEFPLGPSLTGLVQGSVGYVGDRKDNFVVPPLERDELPGYVQTDLSFGLRYNTWTASLFVNNLTDERAALASLTTRGQSRVNYIQPRTMGLSLQTSF